MFDLLYNKAVYCAPKDGILDLKMLQTFLGNNIVTTANFISKSSKLQQKCQKNQDMNLSPQQIAIKRNSNPSKLQQTYQNFQDMILSPRIKLHFNNTHFQFNWNQSSFVAFDF